MRPLLIILALLLSFSAYADKPQWTYAFFTVNGSTDEICKAAQSVKNGRVIVYADTATECGSGKISAKISGMKDFFSYVRKNCDSWSYAYVISSDTPLNPDKLSGAFAANRADLLVLDAPYSGSLESLWTVRRSANNIAAVSTSAPSKRIYAPFLQKAGAAGKSPAGMAADFVDAYRDAYGTSGEKLSVFAMNPGEEFESFVHLFNSRTSCFPKVIERFDKVMADKNSGDSLGGTNADFLHGLEIVSKPVMVKAKRLIISSFSVNSEFTGPSFFLPADSAIYEKNRKRYLSTQFARDCPGWPEFLDILYKHK